MKIKRINGQQDNMFCFQMTLKKKNGAANQHCSLYWHFNGKPKILPLFIIILFYSINSTKTSQRQYSTQNLI